MDERGQKRKLSTRSEFLFSLHHVHIFHILPLTSSYRVPR